MQKLMYMLKNHKHTDLNRTAEILAWWASSAGAILRKESWWSKTAEFWWRGEEDGVGVFRNDLIELTVSDQAEDFSVLMSNILEKIDL